MTLDELRSATQAAWDQYLIADNEMRTLRDKWSILKGRLEAAESDSKIEEEVQRRLAAKEEK